MTEKGAGLLFDETLGVEAFGRRLIETRDLDPVYCGLVDAKLPQDQLARWLLCYWCFYHVGAASWLSEQEGADFWTFMSKAAANLPERSPRLLGLPADRWPRGAERRHFRGPKCVAAVEWLAKNCSRPAEDYVERLTTAKTAERVMAIVQGWPMMGKWVSFKAADMVERVCGAPISFPENICLLYDEPLAGLKLAAHREGIYLGTLHDRLLDYFRSFPAPPTLDRPCGPAEVESILCKTKSYWGGHYFLGKDIREQRAALVGWGATAQQILGAYPPLVF